MKVEAWGRRKLAYPVAKQKKGVYIYVKYLGRGNLVAELERNLKIADDVVKFQTVQLRDNVDLATVSIDPEEAKFQRLELPSEPEEAESREKALGLVDLGPDAPRSRREEPEEFDADGDDKKDEHDDIVDTLAYAVKWLTQGENDELPRPNMKVGVGAIDFGYGAPASVRTGRTVLTVPRPGLPGQKSEPVMFPEFKRG